MSESENPPALPLWPDGFDHKVCYICQISGRTQIQAIYEMEGLGVCTRRSCLNIATVLGRGLLVKIDEYN